MPTKATLSSGRARSAGTAAGERLDAANDELHAALVAVAAAAFAIDGLYGATKRFVAVPQNLRGSGWRTGSPAPAGSSKRLSAGSVSARRRTAGLASCAGCSTSATATHHDADFRPPTVHPLLGDTTPERQGSYVDTTVRASTASKTLIRVDVTRSANADPEQRSSSRQAAART